MYLKKLDQHMKLDDLSRLRRIFSVLLTTYTAMYLG